MEADGIQKTHPGPLVGCIKTRGLRKAIPSSILLPTTPVTVVNGGRNKPHGMYSPLLIIRLLTGDFCSIHTGASDTCETGQKALSA